MIIQKPTKEKTSKIFGSKLITNNEIIKQLYERTDTN